MVDGITPAEPREPLLPDKKIREPLTKKHREVDLDNLLDEGEGLIQEHGLAAGAQVIQERLEKKCR